jgi:hypothetical protein
MTKINSTPSIAKQRIHASFVERNRTIIDRASSVEPVNPVNPVQNNIGYSSANHLMTSDLLYDKLEDLKRDYLDFYNHERNLHRAIDEINLDEEIQLEMMKNLFDKYNRAIIALSHFDHQLRTNNVRKIKEIILEYSIPLNNLGIYLLRETELGIDEEKYKNNLMVSKEIRKTLFKPLRHMLLLLYREFRNIKGPYRENFDDKYPEFPEGDSSGLVLDAKS